MTKSMLTPLEAGPTQEELSRQVQAASRAVEKAVDKGIKERQQAAKALEEATTNYLNIPKPAPTEKEQVEAVRKRFGRAEGGKPAPIGMFQGLSLLGVSQANIDKMTEATGDIPVAVADAIIYLGDKAREAGLIDDPKKNKNVDEPRKNKAEGSMMMPEEGMPIDTYPNIPEDEMDEALASQLPDAEMEEEYIDFVMDESLDDEEQDYLAGVLQKDPRLSDILDKVITVASEFSGAGEVDGPGTGVSDSIPARLSDGEFVFTKKATDQIGADNLQRMMDDAERAYDGGYQMEAEGGLMQNLEEPLNLGMGQTRDEIERLMMRSNKMPSLQ